MGGVSLGRAIKQKVPSQVLPTTSPGRLQLALRGHRGEDGIVWLFTMFMFSLVTVGCL